MDILFVGNDRYYAEGIRRLFEDMYNTRCRVTFSSYSECTLLIGGLKKVDYDFLIFDSTSFNTREIRNIYGVISRQPVKMINLTDSGGYRDGAPVPLWWCGLNYINKSWSLLSVTRKLNELREVLDDIHEDNYQKNTNNFLGDSKITEYEMNIIVSLSCGNKVKDIARELNRSDKTIYRQISLIRKKIGLERKNQFLTFLSAIDANSVMV